MWLGPHDQRARQRGESGRGRGIFLALCGLEGQGVLWNLTHLRLAPQQEPIPGLALPKQPVSLVELPTDSSCQCFGPCLWAQ